MSGNLPALKNDVAKMQGEFAKALPGHITPEKFVRTAQTAIALTRNIEKVKSPASLMAACSKAASDGLILDGREAALVVDYNGDVQYRPMMRGLLKLAYNSGEIKGIVVEVVRKGDVFRHTPTRLVEPIYHEINHEAERGDPHTVYALAELKDGGIVHEVMSVDDVNRIRDRSDAYKAFKAGKIKSTPWSTDWSEMARKTVFRRLSKYLPSSTDRDRFHQAAERIDDDYTFEIDGETVESKPAPQQQKKRGGAAAALKDISPKQTERQRVPDDGGPTGEYDPQTGEFYPDRDDYGDDRGPGDDI
jgi:recombination protein RecT